MSNSVNRRAFVAGSAASVASAFVPPEPARAAEFSMKLGHDLALETPLHVRLIEATNAIRTESNGRLDIRIFGNNSLGSDPAMLSQVRSNALQFMAIAGVLLAAVVPVAAIDGTGFAFKTNADAVKAFDGPLGAYVRKEIAAKGLYAFEKTWDVGFRQVTSGTHPIKSVDDLANFKIRTPQARIYVDLFKTLGASPAPIVIAELYTALQTKVVDGCELPYILLQAFRYYEVQKYLAVTNHSWTGYWLVANPDAWKGIPADLQAVAERNFAKYALLQRRDTVVQNGAAADKLQREGLTFNQVDRTAMRARLAPYYERQKAEFGATAWGLLEAASGKLG